MTFLEQFEEQLSPDNKLEYLLFATQVSDVNSRYSRLLELLSQDSL